MKYQEDWCGPVVADLREKRVVQSSNSSRFTIYARTEQMETDFRRADGNLQPAKGKSSPPLNTAAHGDK